VAWDEPKESFDTERAATFESLNTATLRLRELDSDLAGWKKKLISGDGKCPTCGTIAANHDHVLAANASVNAAIVASSALAAYPDRGFG